MPPPDTDLAANGKAAFFGLAAHLMKRLLIHHSRPIAAKQISVELEDVPRHLSVDSVTDVEIALCRLQAFGHGYGGSWN